MKRLISRAARMAGFEIRRAITPQSKLVFGSIPGWFTMDEAEALYLIAATTTSKRILEIGHFLGRSTSAICEGVRDSGRAVDFKSYDIGFKDRESFLAHYETLGPVNVPPELEEMVF